MVKQIDIVNEKWNYLIVLDACRYDYFERHWKTYLKDGTLECRQSVGSCTNEWRDQSFPGRYEDIVYISANPQISSSAEIYGYCAGDHFSKVIDVWENNWDKEIGTVLPGIMTDETLKVLQDDNVNNKRVIIHYLQPHAPYISLGTSVKGHATGDLTQRTGFIKPSSKSKVSAIKKALYDMTYKIFKDTHFLGNHPDWKLRKFFKLPPKTPMEHLLQKHSVQELRNAYSENLTAVLKEVSRLVEYLSGRIVITSDHGEFLGEDNYFSHPQNCDHPIVRNVPWLEITQDKPVASFKKETSREASSPKTDQSDKLTEEAIIERLRDLGYHS